eukprot:4064614-Amphidinium_carterae.1
MEVERWLWRAPCVAVSTRWESSLESWSLRGAFLSQYEWGAHDNRNIIGKLRLWVWKNFEWLTISNAWLQRQHGGQRMTSATCLAIGSSMQTDCTCLPDLSSGPQQST